jgi:hypothetical protein
VGTRARLSLPERQRAGPSSAAEGGPFLRGPNPTTDNEHMAMADTERTRTLQALTDRLTELRRYL